MGVIMKFVKITEQELKLRMLLYGAPGSGKTFGALLIAKALGGKCALLDTEAGRSSHKLRCPQLKGFNWDVAVIDSPTVDDYCDAIVGAYEQGYTTIILDSLTPEWEAVSSNQSSITKTGMNNFQAWGKAKAPHKKFINILLSTPIHIISTCRSRIEYVVENGKPRKVGLAPYQDPQIGYYFDVVLQLEDKAISIVDKDESEVFKPDSMIDDRCAVSLLEWLGTTPATSTPSPVSDPEPNSSAQSKDRLRQKYIKRIMELAESKGAYYDPEELDSYSLDQLLEIGKSLSSGEQ